MAPDAVRVPAAPPAVVFAGASILTVEPAMAVVMACTTVLGYLLWRERVNRIGLAGIALGLAAVLLTIAGDSPPSLDIGQ